MYRLKDKVALVTGAASGIGRASALLLSQEGAKVVVTDVNGTDGAKVVTGIEKAGGTGYFIHLDVSVEEDWIKAVDGATGTFGRLDIVVNNAGLLIGGDAEETTLAEWREQMSVDLDGVFLGVKHGIRGIKSGGRGGSIINISSAAGLVGFPNLAAYSAAKGGLRLLTKSAALHCAKTGTKIRVNSIHPGAVLTPRLERGLRASGDLEMGLKAVAAMHPLGHIGEPDDIGWGVVYLASDEAKFITGTELIIDGGWTAQ
jgi:3(or 17)beta-hydroxysteroid dehydrogenase